MQEISERREWLEQLKRVVNEPSLTDQGRQSLVMEITNLRRDIKTLIEKRDSVIKYEKEREEGVGDVKMQPKELQEKGEGRGRGERGRDEERRGETYEESHLLTVFILVPLTTS